MISTIANAIADARGNIQYWAYKIHGKINQRRLKRRSLDICFWCTKPTIVEDEKEKKLSPLFVVGYKYKLLFP